MRQLFLAIHDATLDLWSHRLTAAIGVLTMTSTLDLLRQVLAVIALLVAIYCSLARNDREKRAAARAGERPAQ